MCCRAGARAARPPTRATRRGDGNRRLSHLHDPISPLRNFERRQRIRLRFSVAFRIQDASMPSSYRTHTLRPLADATQIVAAARYFVIGHGTAKRAVPSLSTDAPQQLTRPTSPRRSRRIHPHDRPTASADQDRAPAGASPITLHQGRSSEIHGVATWARCRIDVRNLVELPSTLCAEGRVVQEV